VSAKVPVSYAQVQFQRRPAAPACRRAFPSAHSIDHHRDVMANSFLDLPGLTFDHGEEIAAPRDGVVQELLYATGDQVEEGAQLLSFHG
jgi:hypothetical protein